MRRGRHDRRWIKCYDLDGNGYDEYEVEYEVAAQDPGYGVFSIIHHWYREKYYVVWRKNRNVTRDTIVMRDPLGGDHVWQREEVGYGTLDLAIMSLDAWNTCFEFPMREKRHRPRDSQKSKVYRWEHQMAKDIGTTEQVSTGKWPNGSESFVERNYLERKRSDTFLRDALEHICFNMNEHPVELKFRTGGRSSFGGRNIRLLPCHRNLLVLLHELAHVLTRRWYGGKRIQSHGPEFVGVYAYLLIRFGEVKRDAIVRHAAKANVKMSLPDRYWTWADEAVPVEIDEDFTNRVEEAA